MWTTRCLSALMMAALLGSGCGGNSSEALAPTSAQLVTDNGLLLNGLTLNGLTLNGLTLNGLTLNGLTLNGLTLNGLTLNGLTLNGLTLNGLTLNGTGQNGITLNGITLNGITLNGITLNGLFLTGPNNKVGSYSGISVKNVAINNSEIQITLSNNQVISGTQVIGAALVAIQEGPKPVIYVFRINNAYIDTSNPFDDTWHYYVTVASTANPTPTALCLDENNQPTDLVPLMGMYWNTTDGSMVQQPNAVTLACTGGAIEKCVGFGYRPWANGTSCIGWSNEQFCWPVSLVDYLQACTRMIRADYCGNGTSYTVDGTVLNIYDYLSPPIQSFATNTGENWQFEARWTPDGAMCLTKPRHPELWPGGCPAGNSDHLVPLPACNPNQIDSGLEVSTFDPLNLFGLPSSN